MRQCLLAWMVFASCVGIVVGEDNGIRFPPKVIVKPEPQVIPLDSIYKLTVNKSYVIESDRKIHVTCSPVGLVTVTTFDGPFSIRSQFVGSDKRETKTFKGPFVYNIEAISDNSGKVAKTGRVEIIVLDCKENEVKEIRETIEVVGETSDKQEVEPNKDEKKKEPEPKPNKLDAVRLVVIRDPSDMVPANSQILADIPFWKSFTDKGHKVRFYSYNEEKSKPYMADLPSGTGLPVLIIYNEADTEKPLVRFQFPIERETVRKYVEGVSK